MLSWGGGALTLAVEGEGVAFGAWCVRLGWSQFFDQLKNAAWASSVQLWLSCIIIFGYGDVKLLYVSALPTLFSRLKHG